MYIYIFIYLFIYLHTYIVCACVWACMCTLFLLLPASFFRQYLAIANDYIRDRNETASLLSLEECLAVRLYSGPAFQPINTFLRQLAASSGAHRTALARHPALSFAATCRHLSAAVRKLAAVATTEEVARPLYRCIK